MPLAVWHERREPGGRTRGRDSMPHSRRCVAGILSFRPSTRRVYMAGARAVIRAASLELWQNPSTIDLMASIGKSPSEKRVRISPFLDF